jgi:hypothetical protein
MRLLRTVAGYSRADPNRRQATSQELNTLNFIDTVVEYQTKCEMTLSSTSQPEQSNKTNP